MNISMRYECYNFTKIFNLYIVEYYFYIYEKINLQTNV